MASLNLSANGPSITKSYQSIVNGALSSGAAANSPSYGQWAVFTVQAPLVSAFQQDSAKESVLKVQSTGEGELVDMIEEFSDGRIQFAFVKVKDPNTTLPKSVLIGWCGEGVPERTKGYFTSHLAAVSKLLHGYHVQITARSDRDLTPDLIVRKVADASGSKYSGGGSIPSASSGGPPPVASKPAFTPTRVGGGGAGFNALGRNRSNLPKADEGEDGWGADAPQITRTQLEKVAPAYKPTKVNINELTSQKSEPSRFVPPPSNGNGAPDVVKGAYQPIGKVDIAAIRAAAKEKVDDRPTTVKGAYEPVGKVDIAAIRARAQTPGDAPPRGLSPAVTGASGRSEEREEAPKSLAERSAAFSQSQGDGRLTSLPKPKVANRFGSSSTFTGTKAPSPAGFAPKPAVGGVVVGAASKTFADEGGKTPAQIWAEKKARERGGSIGESRPSITSPMKSQTSGEGGWKSGYAGKSWAPVQTTRTGGSSAGNISQQNTGTEPVPEEDGTDPAGSVSNIRDRFKDEPPPVDMSSRPGARGVPMPGLPSRSSHNEIPATQHVDIPSPPAQPRSPSPPTPDYRPSSPIRIAMPVPKTKEPEPMKHEEEQPPAMPIRSLGQAAAAARAVSPEQEQEDYAAHGASHAAAAASQGGKRAVILYDYEKAEENELELREGEHVTNIEMVDDDWWMGQNEAGESGLFPSNYVELVEDEAPSHAPAPKAAPEPPAAAPAAGKGQIATAVYDYEAAEENELSFPENAKIENVEFPDEDWWFGEYGGKSGLFPANYVQLDE